MGTLHLSDRQWDGRKPGGRGGFAHRTDGYRQSRKVWICRQCRRWHADKKPTQCHETACLASAKFMYYFDSSGEAQRYLQLWREYDYGEITGLEHHPRYPLIVHPNDGSPPVKIGTYEADSRYFRDGEPVVEDFKPSDYRALDPKFVWKRRHFEAQYGIQIRIVS